MTLSAVVWNKALSRSNYTAPAPDRLARVYCCCGWVISKPQVHHRYGGTVAIECTGCNKSTGYKSALDVAEAAWQRIANV